MSADHNNREPEPPANLPAPPVVAPAALPVAVSRAGEYAGAEKARTPAAGAVLSESI